MICRASIRMNGVSGICGFMAILLAFPAQAAVLPPDPSNAALVYYQALLLCPEPPDRTVPRPRELRFPTRVPGTDWELPSQMTECVMREVERGEEPDELVRRYLASCNEAIKLAERAAQIQACDWGVWYSGDVSSNLSYLVPVRLLARVLCADARVLAADGDIRGAVDRCSIATRLARHMDDDAFLSYAVSGDITRRVQKCVAQILGSVPVDAETIVSVRDQLSPLYASSRVPARLLRVEFEFILRAIRTDNKMLSDLRRRLAQAPADTSEQDLGDLTDDELLARIREPYAEFLGAALQVIASDMPYDAARTEMQSSTDTLERNLEKNAIADPVIRWFKPWVKNVRSAYDIHLLSTARSNALDTALAVYLTAAQTGQIPEVLPDGLRGDPYSGEPFRYEKTDSGFTLSCRVKPAHYLQPLTFEYSLKQ